jgi:hypothetical protein
MNGLWLAISIKVPVKLSEQNEAYGERNVVEEQV